MRNVLHWHFGQHRILGGAAVLAATQFAASLAGLFRDRLLAGTFPGLDTVDVYIASFRPSDLLFQMFIMSAFSVALVPMLASYLVQGRREEMSRLLSGVMWAASLIFGALALVLIIVFPRIAPFLVQFDGESLDLYVTFGRLALLTNLLFVFGNAFGQYLITIQRYWMYGLTPVLYTLGTIVGTVLLTPSMGPMGPMIGTLGGAVLYVLVRLFAVMRMGYRPRFLFWHGDLTEMGVLMLPRIVALGALQFQLLFFDRIASGLDAGAVTVNAYTRNFQSVAVGLAGVALAQSAFSLLSQAAAQKEHGRFRLYLRKGIGMMLLLTIPGAILLVLLGNVAAMLVSLESVLPVFLLCLSVYALSIPFECLNHLLLRAFYALKDTLTPALISMASAFISILAAWFLVQRFGVMSLALGYTIGQVVLLVGLGTLLPSVLKRR